LSAQATCPWTAIRLKKKNEIKIIEDKKQHQQQLRPGPTIKALGQLRSLHLKLAATSKQNKTNKKTEQKTTTNSILPLFLFLI